MAPPRSTEIATTQGAPDSHSNPKIPFLSLIPKIPLGFLNWGGERADAKSTEESKAVEGGDSRTSANPDVVRFRLRAAEVEPLKWGSDETSDPHLFWQVAKMGLVGYIVVKCAWAKWQQWQAGANEDDSAQDQDQPPEDD